MKTWARRRCTVPVVLQMDVSDCGPACLTAILRLHRSSLSLEEVAANVGLMSGGSNARSLVLAARRLGLAARGVRAEVDDLRRMPVGSILHWGMDHFVVLEDRRRRGAFIMDPAMGRAWVPLRQLDELFSGIAILTEPTPAFVAELGGAGRDSLLSGLLRSHRRAVASAIVMALIYELFVIALPILNGILVARIVDGDAAAHAPALLLACIGAALGLAVAHVWRGRLLLGLRQRLDMGLLSSALDALMRKPLLYFEQRSAGDLLMRLNGASVLRDVLMMGLMRTSLDALTVGIALIVLTVIEPVVGLAAGVAVGAVLVPVFLLRHRISARNSTFLRERADAQSKLLQLVRGAEAAKAGGVEGGLAQDWLNVYSRELEAMTSLGSLRLVIEAGGAAALAALPALLLLVAGMEGGWNPDRLGAMVAVAGVGAASIGPVAAIAGSLVDVQVMRGHLDRLREFAFGDEHAAGARLPHAGPVDGEILVRNATFHPHPDSEPVLHEVNLAIGAGEMVAIVGRTGAGKTTLGKLIAGLYAPTSGSVSIGGVELTPATLGEVRRRLGVVTQAPYIFPGTIQANIQMLAEAPTSADVQRAALVGGLQPDLDRLPSGLLTSLGEDGAPLSGGQRQRLCLSRALCRRPVVLLLDEATNQQDEQTEAEILANLAAIDATKILIAHSLRVVRQCDRVITVADGRIESDLTTDAFLRSIDVDAVDAVGLRGTP